MVSVVGQWVSESLVGRCPMGTGGSMPPVRAPLSHQEHKVKNACCPSKSLALVNATLWGHRVFALVIGRP